MLSVDGSALLADEQTAAAFVGAASVGGVLGNVVVQLQAGDRIEGEWRGESWSSLGLIDQWRVILLV